MNILALETGGANWGAACVALDERRAEAGLLAFYSSEQPRELSTTLFARVQSTLDAANWSLGDVDALAVGLGPGSWTGLRIGLSAAKTLAQARNWPLAGVPSFDAVAQAAWRARGDGASTLLLVAEKCRPGEINAKIYECAEDYLAVAQGEWIGGMELVADTLSTEALARGLDAPFLLCGGAAQTVADVFEARGGKYSLHAPPFENPPFENPPFEKQLLELAIAGASKIESGEADDPMTLQPLYLAPSNAERNLLAR
jgi:tRNA threonylcarbamoyl adenosine modification protein YeaZ